MCTSGSNVLDTMGLNGLDIGYVLIGVLVLFLACLVLLIVLLVKNGRMKKRLDALTRGSDGSSLEQDIVSLYDDNQFLKANAEKNKKEIRYLRKRLEGCFQKMGLVKYDAFHQMGGQLSFSLCLLDENNNGYIINSVHSTEGCYSYTKEVKAGESDIDLGKEEAQALSIALGEE